MDLSCLRRHAAPLAGVWLGVASIAAAPLQAATRFADDPAPARYRVRMNAEEKSWTVTATFPHSETGDLEFQMARWTAGAYHLAEYGSFVTELTATSEDGSALAVTRDGTSRFVIDAGESHAVTLTYTARACAQKDVNDHMVLNVEGNRITQEYGFVSPNSLLGFVARALDRPCELVYELPAGWKVACALPAKDDGTLVAPSWYRLEDSPALFSPTQLTVPFEVDGIPHWVTLYGGTQARADQIADHCRRLVEAGRDWMQGLPYDRYHFLLGFTANEGGGAGLEHSNSTLIFCEAALGATSEYDHLLAHEYFHCWCAERIHVDALERPDYTQPLETGTIWVNEGITEYFCRHLMLTAGLCTRQQFFDELANEGGQAKAMWGMAGDRSWTDVSRATADWKGMGDLIAFSIKHYQGGCWTMLALDLEMREASKGERGIADLLRYLNRAYAQRGRGFGEEEMPAIVAGIAQADLDDFFDAYIDGPKLPDLKTRLQTIGYTTKGGLGRVVALPDPTPEQRAALEDFFTPPPAR